MDRKEKNPVEETEAKLSKEQVWDFVPFFFNS
jgi:hypothetical protein